VRQAIRFGGTPLLVQVLELEPYVIGQWAGTAPDGARETAREAIAELLHPRTPTPWASERVVFDLGRLHDAGEAVTALLARAITEAQRLGRNVCLVRCSEKLFRRLRAGGMAGAVTHSGSLLAATQGLAGDRTSTLDLHLRSSPELLPQIRSVVAALAREAGLPERAEIQVKLAVTEAATNAILHGSPQGPRNHVHVSFHLDPETLIVDVADQGPGFDPGSVPHPRLDELPERGFGISMMERSVDRVEFYHDDRGMVVRMTKYLQPGVSMGASGNAGWAS